MIKYKDKLYTRDELVDLIFNDDKEFEEYCFEVCESIDYLTNQEYEELQIDYRKAIEDYVDTLPQ